MIDHSFKSWLALKCRKPVELMVQWRIHPDILSWFGFFISSASFFFIITDHPLWALIAWWSGRIFDGLDGMVARAGNRQSHRGGFLDINLDMAAYGFVAIGFMLKTQLYVLWAFILLGYILCITSALTLGDMEEAKDNRSLRIASGLAEAGETGIFYSLIWLFPSYTSLWCKLWLVILFITVVSRFLRVYKKGPRS